MKLPQEFIFEEANRKHVVSVVEKKTSKVLCWITKRLAEKENAELIYTGDSKGEIESSPSNIVFDENDATVFTSLKIDNTACNLRHRDENGNKSFIIACDDVAIEKLKDISTLYCDSSENRAIFQSFLITQSSFSELRLVGLPNANTKMESFEFGKLRLSVFSAPEGITEIISAADAHNNLVMENVKNNDIKIRLDYPERGKNKKPRVFTFKGVSFSPEKKIGDSTLTFSAGKRVEVQDVRLLLCRGGQSGTVICKEEFRAIGRADSSNTPIIRFLAGARKEKSVEALNLDAELNDSTVNTFEGLFAPEANIKIKQQNTDNPKNVYFSDFSVMGAKNCALNIEGGAQCFGGSMILLPDGKEFTVRNSLAMHKLATLSLDENSISSIDELALERTDVKNIYSANSDGCYNGHLNIISSKVGDCVKDITLGENIKDLELILGLDDDYAKSYAKCRIENVKFIGDKDKCGSLLVEVFEKDQRDLVSIKDCEFLGDINVILEGSGSLALEGSNFSDNIRANNSLSIKDSELKSTDLDNVKRVERSLLVNGQYRNVDEIVDYIGFSEYISNTERLETKEINKQADIQKIESVKNKELDLRNIEL